MRKNRLIALFSITGLVAGAALALGAVPASSTPSKMQIILEATVVDGSSNPVDANVEVFNYMELDIPGLDPEDCVDGELPGDFDLDNLGLGWPLDGGGGYYSVSVASRGPWIARATVGGTVHYFPSLVTGQGIGCYEAEPFTYNYVGELVIP